MRNRSLILASRTLRHQNIVFTAIISFILGSLITVNFVPINKTCKLDDTDREYNIMKNSELKNDELIVLILSAPDNLAKRNVIRLTWLNFKPKGTLRGAFTFTHYFVIGRYGLSVQKQEQIISEQSLYNDILLLPVYDSYKNLTEKVLKSFIWLNEQRDIGFDFKYVLKCDDDTFVEMNKLLHEIPQIEQFYLGANPKLNSIHKDQPSSYLTVNIQRSESGPRNGLYLYWGYFNGKARVRKSGIWKQDNWILCDFYVPYALGGGYILSKQLVLYLARNAEHLRRYNSEDISIGAWLSSLNNVIRIHDIRFDTEWVSRGCQNNYLVTHHVSEKEMQEFYDNIINTGNLCESESLSRVPYLYNWSATPSKCCSNFVKKNNLMKDIMSFFPIRL